MVTFIITLVVTALISVIVTSLYYKRHYIKKSVIRQESDSHAITEDIKSNDPAYAIARVNVPMDTNPAYGTVTTIKMDANPAYATTVLLEYIDLVFVDMTYSTWSWTGKCLSLATLHGPPY